MNHERIHRNEKPLKCDFEGCEYSCSDPSNMSSHRKKHEEPRFGCGICGRRFRRGDALKRHAAVHEDEGGKGGNGRKKRREGLSGKAEGDSIGG